MRSTSRQDYVIIFSFCNNSNDSAFYYKNKQQMQAVCLYLFVGVGHQESHGRHPGSLQDGENPLQNRHLVDIFTKLL